MISSNDPIRTAIPPKTVYIVNHSGHDFSGALKFGTIKYLSSGTMSKYEVNEMYRTMQPLLALSKKEDYILPTSLPILSAVAVSIFVAMHGRVNFLLFDAARNRYVSRTLVFNQETSNVGQILGHAV